MYMGFPSIAQNFCLKSPISHKRKKMCVIIQIELKHTTFHAKQHIADIKINNNNKINSR